ncbi:MAG: hypothetical protein ACREQR_01265 [Candidatus Binataceae bacterium]
MSVQPNRRRRSLFPALFAALALLALAALALSSGVATQGMLAHQAAAKSDQKSLQCGQSIPNRRGVLGRFFVQASAFQSAYPGFPIEGFVAKLSSDGSTLICSTYLGGSTST